VRIRWDVPPCHIEQVVAKHTQPEQLATRMTPDKQANVILRDGKHQTVWHEEVHSIPRGVPFRTDRLAFRYSAQALKGVADGRLATFLYSPEQVAQ
jgi:hypothetical protein